jgi:hypothetical protein
MMRQLEVRWTGTDDFTDVDYCASFDEAKSKAIAHQLNFHIRAPILWTVDDASAICWGRNKHATYRLRPI